MDDITKAMIIVFGIIPITLLLKKFFDWHETWKPPEDKEDKIN